MNLSGFDIYIVIINIVGFICYCINMLLYRFTNHGQIDKLLTIVSFLGGTLGIILAILLFDRKNEKDNMMSRVFVFCMFVIQLVLFIMFKGNFFDKLSLNVFSFFQKYKILLIYLGIINFVTFTMFAIDKINAISGKWRYKIVTLLGLCFIGGSIGGLLSMYIFRHKTKVDYFTWGIPLMIIMQIVVTIFLVNII